MSRRRLRAALALVVVVTALAPGGVGAGGSADPVFVVEPCPPDAFPADRRVTCGFVTVPERRDVAGGKRIRIAAAVVHATAPRPKPDPIVFLDGGPSFGAISPFALDLYFAGAAYADDRDLVLVDTRGTGLSRPRLGCPELDRASVSAFYSRPLVDTSYATDYRVAVRACRDRLRADGIDLAAYNSAESAADLDDLRRALGHRDWNLLAISADGVLGLTYMRLFPRHIRSAILDSPIGPQHLGDLDYMRGLAENLELVFAGCAANAACAQRYPAIRERFLDLVDELEANPRVVTFPAFQPRPIRLEVDGVNFYRDALFGVFPGDLGAQESIHPLLSEIWRSIHGDLATVYRERFGEGPFTSDADSFLAQGKTMSYLCRDVIGFLTTADVRRAAQDLPELEAYFRESPFFQLPFGPEGCRIWDNGLADPVQHRPVESRIPTLVLAGEFDSAVPSFLVRQIPPTLSRSTFLEFPGVGHLQLAAFNPASSCARSIAGAFLAAPAARPNAACVGDLPAFDFTPPAGP